MRLVHRRRYPIDHFVLIDEVGALAPERLVAEARRHAEVLAARCTGGTQNFTLIHNGAGIARSSDPHVHIFCTRSRFHKGLLYLAIGLKNVFGIGSRTSRN